MGALIGEYRKLSIAGAMAPTILSDITEVTVGPGGMFATIGEAIEYATKTFSTIYNSAVFTTGVYVDIILLSGFVMAEQIAIHSRDLGWIRISSEDAEVTIQRSALVTAYGGRYPAFYCQTGRTPYINTKFVMDDLGTATDRDGLFLDIQGIGRLASGKGFRNCGGHGVAVFLESCLYAGAAILTGCVYGIYAGGNSHAYGSSIDVSDSTLDGVLATSGSSLSIPSIVANDCTRYGLWASGNGTIHATSATVLRAGAIGAFADQNSDMNLQTSTITGATTNGVKAQQGSRINMVSTNAQKGGSPASTDIVVASGSHITAINATGGLSQTKNVVTANGCIYQV
jgi:hypothetical protein